MSLEDLIADNKTAIPSIEEGQQALEMLRVSNQQLELTAIALDELITTVEGGLSCQHHQSLEKSRTTTFSNTAT